ncbi:MAG: ribonuclease HII [Chitinophagales bacterium]|jgi:ribonuclease HII|nr:ribonuclease HII [Bacteroidota bacterium]MBK9556116.1 ribonuclease HII [Bacteroidota bacterium]MBL0278802.1 ribonuclease HII [Bacteroidota bacterium]MBP8248493.1 ribonuclease HII [Chitinophagales bacterium]MBP9879326.1 ribonuclease HII [Chitinophagales bacterium]
MLQASYQDELIEAGCDEAGRGCLAGPVVAAAVILPKNFFHPLLNDSKQLTENERELLAPIIKAAAIDWKIGICDNHEIDAINILKASFKAMHKAVDQMKKKPGLLLIDGNRFYKYPRIPHICIVKGDARFMSIAAASVLAKTYRDDLMHQLHTEFPVYNWQQNKGYPTKDHRRAIAQFGSTNYHRKTFRLLPENEASLFE